MMLSKRSLKYFIATLNLLGSVAAVSKTVPKIATPLSIQARGLPVIINSQEADKPNLAANIAAIGLGKAILNYKSDLDYPEYYNLPLILSGGLQSSISLKSTKISDKNTEKECSLAFSRMELDGILFPNTWVTAYFAMSYDSKSDNGQLALDRAAIVLGNFTRSPFYVAIGKFPLAFGQYTSSVGSDPLTKSLGLTKGGAAATVGFYQSFESGSQFGFSVFGCNSRTGPTKATLKSLRNYGADLGFGFKRGEWELKLGTSVMANLAESKGLQSGDCFGKDEDSQILLEQVPTVDVRGSLKAGPLLIAGECIMALKKFPEEALKFNGQGAKPNAWHGEISYRLASGLLGLSEETSFAFGYGQSEEALKITPAKASWFGAIQMPLAKNMTGTLSYRYNQAYAITDTITNNLGNANTGEVKDSHSINLSFGLSF